MVKKNKLFLSLAEFVGYWRLRKAFRDHEITRHVPDYGLVKITSWPTYGHGDIQRITLKTGGSWIIRYTISEGVHKGYPVTVRELSLRYENERSDIEKHISYILVNGTTPIKVNPKQGFYVTVQNAYTPGDFIWPDVPSGVIKALRKLQIVNLMV